MADKEGDTVRERTISRDGDTQINPNPVFSGDNIKELVGNPKSLHKNISKAVNRVYYKIKNSSDHNDAGIDIFEEDWDNMIILDACRYDEFAVCSDLPGKLTKKRSKASMTHEWIVANFTKRTLHDLVYVSANGNYIHQKDAMDSEVYKFVGLWTDDYRTGSKNMVTPPETVTEKTIKLAENYPEKKLLIHYLQPHYPYIGPTGEDFINAGSLNATIEKNEISNETLRKAYRENLEIVLKEVEKLLPHLEGKTVVTSDHGEMLGERSFPAPIHRYGHPRGIYTSELTEIPWHIHINGPRKEITAEEPPESEDIDEDAIEDHLRNLGYVI